VKDFWFEIVRRSRKRYEWVFVGTRDGRPRVLARSGRDYRSRKKTRRAIRRLQYAFPRADSRNADPFPLPYTKFEVVPGVLPLRVQSAPSGYVPASAREPGFGALPPARSQEPAEPSAQEEQQPEPREQPEQERKPVTAGRRRKTT
jgi:hypothetical protein